MNKKTHAWPTKILAVLLVSSFLLVACYQPSQIVQAAPTASLQQIEQLTVKPLQSSDPITHPNGYTPDQIKTAYNLPSSGGDGATIAIIVAGHTSNILSYLSVFCINYSLPALDGSNFEVHEMTGAVGSDSAWCKEACLDVEWAHAIAPQAKILLVEAVDTRLSSLRAAVDYATGRSDVSVVSMSWGYDENGLGTRVTTFDDECFKNKPGIAFFAASGDSGAQVLWPACSPYVTAVGGTVLDLQADGTVNSEVAWSGSGGGVSVYESMPTYQSNYGLTGGKRIVPDVSIAATNIPVYYSSGWSISTGTSAGPPQWAAIYALGMSATNDNLYRKATTDYSTSFRDITSGSNGHSATVGFDYVTGLGSPLTFNFSPMLTILPEGPEVAVFAVTLAALLLVVLIKKK